MNRPKSLLCLHLKKFDRIITPTYVTTVQMQQPDVRIALDLTQEWEKVNPDHPLATGCVVVRTELTENDPETVKSVLSEMADSVSYVNQNVDDAAALIAKFGIIPNAEIAKKAIPYCNITFIHGEEMQEALSDYLTILFEANPVSVGEKLPDEDSISNTERKTFRRFWIILFWLAVWQALSMIPGLNIFLASPIVVFKTFIQLVREPVFWTTVLFSFTRIVAGFIFGLCAGIGFAILSVNFQIIRLLEPIVLLIKSTPIGLHYFGFIFISSSVLTVIAF